MFKNRHDAGEKLADKLRQYKNENNVVVVAIPRGGLVPAKVIADELNLPLEVVLVKKIGHPENSEYAIGAVSLKKITLERGIHVSDEYLQNEIQKNRNLLLQRTSLFYSKRSPEILFGKIVILVDDGVATGNTLRMAIDLIQQEKPRQIILAVPVGPIDTINTLAPAVDEIICLETPNRFQAIGAFYEDFPQITDSEAIELFQRT